ncbi:MAG: 50S ribosomal protein L1 [Thermosphaera sp.]
MPLEHNKLKEAISKAVEVGKGRRFKQSVEMIVVLRDIDPKSQAGKIREIVVLPKGRGKKQKICVVADGELAEKAKSAGAFMVISSAELGSIGKKQAKKIASSCDWVLVRTDLMAQVGRVLGPALGPRGKPPVPMPPSADISMLIKRYENSVVVRTKEQPQLSVAIGTEDMSLEDLVENANSVLGLLESKLPAGMGNVDRILFKTTMGPAVEAV